MNDFYVYYLIDPRNFQPFYVGKGKGKRMYSHAKNRIKHINKILSNKLIKIIDKEGLKIIHKKVYDNLSEEKAFELEMKEISKYGRKNNNTGILCNVTDGGDGPSGLKWSEEIRLKNKRQSPVSQYDLKGNHIKDFPSITMAAERTGISMDCIGFCVNPRIKQKRTGGFIWKYKDEELNMEEIEIWGNCKSIAQYSKNGKLISTYPSLKIASKKTGINFKNISVAANKHQLSGKFLWRYFSESPLEKISSYDRFPQRRKPVYQYSIEGEFIKKFECAKEAAKEVNAHKTNINSAANGRQKTAAGYIWKYE
jgi:hypothetical protein